MSKVPHDCRIMRTGDNLRVLLTKVSRIRPPKVRKKEDLKV